MYNIDNIIYTCIIYVYVDYIGSGCLVLYTIRLDDVLLLLHCSTCCCLTLSIIVKFELG